MDGLLRRLVQLFVPIDLSRILVEGSLRCDFTKIVFVSPQLIHSYLYTAFIWCASVLVTRARVYLLIIPRLTSSSLCIRTLSSTAKYEHKRVVWVSSGI